MKHFSCIPRAMWHEMTRCRRGIAKARDATVWGGPASAVHREDAAPRAGHRYFTFRSFCKHRSSRGGASGGLNCGHAVFDTSPT